MYLLLKLEFVFFLKGLDDFVKGKTFRKPLSLELDKETDKILVNGLEIDIYTKIDPVRL